MNKLGDLSMKVEVDTQAFKDLSEKLERIGSTLQNATMPITHMAMNTVWYRQAALGQYEVTEVLSEYDALAQELSAICAKYEKPLKILQPSDFPIGLRMQYQYQTLMRPIRALQDLQSWLRSRVARFTMGTVDVEQLIKEFLSQNPDEAWGNAHLILSDYNLEDDYIQSALDGEYGEISDVCREFLNQLLAIPESDREAVLGWQFDE